MRPDLITDSISLDVAGNTVHAISANSHPHFSTGSHSNIVDQLPFACFGFSKSGGVQFVNSSGAEFLGLERHELLGRQFASFVSEVHRARFSHVLLKAFATHAKQSCELKLLPIGREPAYVRLEASVARDSCECMAALIDITDCKLAEQSRDIRELAIQAVNQGIVIADPVQPNCPIIYVNDGFEKMTGYTATEAMGKALNSYKAAIPTQLPLLKCTKPFANKDPAPLNCCTIERTERYSGTRCNSRLFAMTQVRSCNTSDSCPMLRSDGTWKNACAIRKKWKRSGN